MNRISNMAGITRPIGLSESQLERFEKGKTRLEIKGFSGIELEFHMVHQ